MSDTVVIPAAQGEGASFGKYQVISELGEGAMGKVYKCYDPDFQRMVAVKTVHKALLDDCPSGEFRERFKNEMRAAGKLTHPNIVAVFDAGEKEGGPFFVMEYVEGQELKHMLDEKMHFTLDQSLKIISNVLSGLSRIHQHGIVHRDLKPANIFVASDGVAKIADFGVAKLDNSEMTQVGTVIGSPKYMSPEQCVGEPADARSDLFAVGIILYEMLTGKYCFNADSTTAITQKIINVEALSASTVAQTYIPTHIDKILKKSLAKKPADRFQSAEEFLSSLTLHPSNSAVPGSGLLVKLGGAVVSVVALGVLVVVFAFDGTQNLGPKLINESRKTGMEEVVENSGNAETNQGYRRLITGGGVVESSGQSSDGARQVESLSTEKSAKIAKLFKVAETYKRIGRLVSPPGSNAYDAYKIVLSIDPDNNDALQGVVDVEIALVDKANQYVETGDHDRALLTAKAGLEVFPDARIFSELVETIEHAPR